ncbi:trypsin-like peptidase domain-containing protein [Acholeplasma granularum]|uniref:trypsin-like peptidase domain-containing protein n=1 Tax=Acholeplasma granularum TaxID=264635 RepID=UPI00138AB04B|nr:trypsin-like peptidase domain-containing protein [Acholeplasma granularum]
MKNKTFILIYLFIILFLVGCSPYQYIPSMDLPNNDTEEKYEEIIPPIDEENPVMEETHNPTEPDLNLEDNIPNSTNEVENEIHINFFVEDKLYNQIDVASIDDIITPDIPSKENYIFIGWYTNNDELFDFDDAVAGTTNLYAKYSVDYLKVINKLSTEYMSTNVEIHTKHWNPQFGSFGEKDIVYGTGSGIIFYNMDGIYFVLTNNHVVEKLNRVYHEYQIEDYKGNVYNANLYKGSESSDYDLAILYFEAPNESLRVSSFASDNPKIDTEMISLGRPHGQDNTITLGVIKSYQTITLSDDEKTTSNVKFEVIRHSAPIGPGSSGGAILNMNFEIIGINFAGPKDTLFNDLSYGFSIPVNEVKNYLNIYFY